MIISNKVIIIALIILKQNKQINLFIDYKKKDNNKKWNIINF